MMPHGVSRRASEQIPLETRIFLFQLSLYPHYFNCSIVNLTSIDNSASRTYVTSTPRRSKLASTRLDTFGLYAATYWSHSAFDSRHIRTSVLVKIVDFDDPMYPENRHVEARCEWPLP